MATASHALYGVDVYSDSSEDSGNWESAGPRHSGGYRVGVSAGNATEKDLDAASVSSSDSEDDAMLVALVSAIACGADRPPVFDPRDPIRPDDSAATADEGDVAEDDDAWEDFSSDEECSASSCSGSSSEDLEGLSFEVSRHRNAARREIPRPAPSRRGVEIDSFAATRPSAVGGRWGPPPRRAAEPKKPANEPFAGPIPTVRAAVARAMAGALERESLKAEQKLLLPDDVSRSSRSKNQSRVVRTESIIAAVADLSSRAEWAQTQAIGYELEGARSRLKYASPEKAEHFSSRRRRAPSSAFAKAPRTSLFAEIEKDVPKTPPSDAHAKKAVDTKPLKRTEMSQWKKPSRGRSLFGAKDESSSDESETDAWWTTPFGGVAAKSKNKTARHARKTALDDEPKLVGLDAMGVAIDRTRPRPSGARGVTKWAKPKPAGSRDPVPFKTVNRRRPKPGKEDSSASASSGASGDSAAWWDGREVAKKALRRRASATPRMASGARRGDGDRDPTRPRVAGPFAWLPPKTNAPNALKTASNASPAEREKRIKLGKRGKSERRGLSAIPAIPSDACVRRRAPCVVFRPLAARKKRSVAISRAKKKGVSRRLAERARRRNARASLLDEDDRSISIDAHETDSPPSTPGPGAYDAAGAVSAIRPSTASAPFFAPRSRPAEIRASTRRDAVHTPDEVPVDLSAEKWRVAKGVKNTFPSVEFKKAPPRVTADEEIFREALLRNAEPTSGERLARRDARDKIAAYEFGEALTLDPLARKIASGEIVAPPEPTFALVEASVKKTPKMRGQPRNDVLDEKREDDDEHMFAVSVRDAYALALDPLSSWRAAVAPAVKRTPVFLKPRSLETLFEREQDEALVRGPTQTHGSPDALARGRNLGGGGALPLRYYLGRDEDYASRRLAREREEELSKPVAYETDERGVNDAPVVASLRVAEALDALRASTPATVFGLAAERWASRERSEKKAEREIKRRSEARQKGVSRGYETYVAGKAAHLLDDEAERNERNRDEERNEERFTRFARAKDSIARSDPASGAAWLGIEAARAALSATRPSAPGWTMLPLEVTKPRVGAGRVVKPGDRPALDVRVSLVRTKGFLDPTSAADFAKAAGRGGADDASASQEPRNPRTGPAAYRTEKADLLLSRRAPAATFGTAERLPKETKETAEDQTEGPSLSEDPTRVSLDRLIRRRRGVLVNMHKDSNPRFDAETLRLQTEARRFRATRTLEKLVGEKSVTEGPVDPTAATRARVPAADFASLTWRVSENSKGRVEMELLEAEIGPGRYDPRDEVTAGRRRAPEADFASAARRFPEDSPDPMGDSPSEQLARDDVVAAAAAVRPRVAVGGVIPDAGKRGVAKAQTDSEEAPLPPSAVVNLEDALRYLRGARHSSAPDFARSAPKLGDGVKNVDTSDARLFADVSAAASAAADGAKGTSRGSNVSAFGKPPKVSPTKPADWKSKDPDAFAEGDVLFLLPEKAREATFPSRFDAPDFAKTLGRSMVSSLVPDVNLTEDVDFVPEKALRSRFPRLDKGTNAVDIGRGREASLGRSRRENDASDLDAGVYAPRNRDVSRGVLSGQRVAPSLVDLAKSQSRVDTVAENAFDGDALVLDAALAADGTRRRRDVGASSFARAPRLFGETAPSSSDGGDALVLHPDRLSALDERSSQVSYARAFDFGRAPGREQGRMGSRARWGEDDVIHALRAEPPTMSTLDKSLAKVHAAGVDGKTLAAARRMERRARLEARMPRRGPGEDAPSRERTDGPVR